MTTGIAETGKGTNPVREISLGKTKAALAPSEPATMNLQAQVELTEASRKARAARQIYHTETLVLVSQIDQTALAGDLRKQVFRQVNRVFVCRIL